MVDYSLWEVIESGNAPPITKLVEGVKIIIAPATAKEKAQRNLELKARRTLLMGIPNEYQLKFNSIKDAKSLLQAIEKSTSSTNRVVNTAHGATTASTQATTVNSTTIDNLSDAVIYGLEVADCYANNKGKEILEEHWKKAYCKWTLKNQENRNRENTIRVVPVKTTTSNTLVSCDGSGYDWSDQAEEGNFMPPKPDLSFSSLEEFVNEPIVSEPTIKKPVVETSKDKASADKPKAVRKNNGALIIKDWVSDSKEEDVPRAKKEKKTVKSSFLK
ncbi:hypothetical protein Tco_0596319 [Tanacetum coccineum]